MQKDTSIAYLESLDSTRLTWGASRGSNSRKTGLQVGMEALVALALGNQIVVPQSYAIDSLCFMNVAQVILTARESALAGRTLNGQGTPRPFRIHLHSATTYHGALRDTFQRIGEAKFHSSLYPELNQNPSLASRIHRAKSLSKSIELLGEVVDGDSRYDAQKTVYEEFTRPGSRHKGASLNAVPSLFDMLTSLIDAASPTRVRIRRLGLDEDANTRSLIDAVAELSAASNNIRPGGGHPFTTRSHVHSSNPWPGDKSGRSCETIVGSDRILDVRELWDTLYNARVSDSIGAIPTVYSTPVATAGISLSSLGVAQELAVAAARATGDFDQVVGQSNFILKISESLTEEQLAQALDDLGGDLVGAFRRLFVGMMETKFAESAAALRRSVNQGAEPEVRASLEKHLELVGRILGNHVQTTWNSTLLSMEFAAAGAFASILVTDRSIINLISGAVGAAIPAAGEKLRNQYQDFRSRSRLSGSLGEIVRIRRVAQR
jgi:hypothetical protein